MSAPLSKELREKYKVSNFFLFLYFFIKMVSTNQDCCQKIFNQWNILELLKYVIYGNEMFLIGTFLQETNIQT